ncbi:MAG: hypothetical protein ACYDH6_23435 [Acidimicrobiales bacterium]
MPRPDAKLTKEELRPLVVAIVEAAKRRLEEQRRAEAEVKPGRPEGAGR